jgi:hypothetical protein
VTEVFFKPASIKFFNKRTPLLFSFSQIDPSMKVGRVVIKQPAISYNIDFEVFYVSIAKTKKQSAAVFPTIYCIIDPTFNISRNKFVCIRRWWCIAFYLARQHCHVSQSNIFKRI